jgi:ribonuclease-3
VEAALPADALKAPKSRLQERAFALSGRAPSYRIVSAEGPDHDRRYVVEASIDGRALGTGEGRNRRDAETMAAEAALATLDDGTTNARATSLEAVPATPVTR